MGQNVVKSKPAEIRVEQAKGVRCLEKFIHMLKTSDNVFSITDINKQWHRS